MKFVRGLGMDEMGKDACDCFNLFVCDGVPDVDYLAVYMYVY